MDYDILPTDEFTTVENRRYLNPNLPVTATNQFIDNYRANQQAQNAQIAQQTQRLGTNVPSNLGGLTGAGSYFTSRYQTPQTNSALQDLRTAAQASALNQALANEQAMWKKRYQDAYNAYQKRQNDKTNTTDDTTEGGVDYNDNTSTYEGDVPGVSDGFTVGMIDTDTGNVLGYMGVPYGQEYQTNYRVNLNDYRGGVGATVVRRAKQSTDMTKSSPGSGGIISVWKLPDGTVTNVDANYYTIAQDSSGNYYARDRESGNVTPIGS